MTGDAVTSSRRVRVVVFLGWAFLALYMLWTAWLGSIFEHPRAYQVAYLIGFVGYAMVAVPLLRRHRRCSPGTWRWWFLGCVALRLIPIGVAGSDDIHRYLWEGRVQLEGFNPYIHPPDDERLAALRDQDWPGINHPDYTAIYGPVAEMTFAVAAFAHPTLHTLKLLHVLWDVLTVAVLGACLVRLNRAPHGAALYALCPLVLSAFAVEGHADSLMLLLIALTAWATLAKKWRVAGVFLGLAISVKAVAIVLLPWFLLRQWRAAVCVIATAVVCHLPYLGAGYGLFASLTRFAATNTMSFLGWLGVPAYDTSASRATVGAAACGVLAYLALRRTSFVRYAAGAMTVTLLATPIVHYWYLSWVLLFVPLGFGMGWLAAACAMVAYFEAEVHRSNGGDWVMPDWAARVVWGSLILAWFGGWVWRRGGGERHPTGAESTITDTNADNFPPG